ncbi:MAG: hypothetical protein HGA85_07450, partial [Nanoarchaeota archaeon]|nr:hypothetical protein [Nanoarchaeota archaeon]
NRIGKSQDRGINFAIAGIILAIICTLAYGSFLISFVFAKFIGAAGIGNPPTDISVSGCGDAISLAIETSEGQPLLCYNKPNSVSSGQLHIMLKNSGRQDVLGWVVVYKGNTSMVTEYDVGLESASIVPFSFASGKSAYEDVEIHPIIQGYRSRSACSYEKLKFKIKELKECAKAGWSD